ncbi:MAG: efflux RND transporter periplasmic adaptor subunit [Armatimonadetes bacterium]|nr:efflux RND transporter periplasmic adaptor subunit [Armatimonadota bacterium]
MKRIIMIVVVVLVVVAGAFFSKSFIGSAKATDKTQYKTAKVTRETVKKTVSATGKLKAWATVDIKSKAGGRVDELLVDIGSQVTKGQVLAKIDPTDTLLNYDQARSDIESSDARIRSSQISWQLQQKQSRLAVSTAESNLESARAALASASARLKTAGRQRDAQPDMTTASIASAQANLDSAVKQLNQLQQATNPQERASAKSAFDQAQANLNNAQANLTRQERLQEKGFVSQQTVDQARASYEVAKAQMESAKSKLDTLKEQQDAAEAAQQARVKQSEAQLRSAKASAIDIDVRRSGYEEARQAVRQSEAALDNAHKSLELARANQANDAIRRTEVATARASKTRAMASLTNAQATLDQTTVRAPRDGVVLQKYVEQGTIISSALSFAASGNNILQIGDITRMYVDVAVDETDIANVDVGQPVEVTIEAYPGIPFEGKVARIDPQAQVESNVTNVHVRVEIDNSAPSFRLLKPEMNATCEFVIDRKDGVVSVPTDAVRTDDQGKYVEVATGGQPAPPDPQADIPADPDTLVGVKIERRTVEVGLEGNDTVEIAKGLRDGELVVTQTIEAEPQQAGGAVGGFGSRMGGRGMGRSRR